MEMEEYCPVDFERWDRQMSRHTILTLASGVSFALVVTCALVGALWAFIVLLVVSVVAQCFNRYPMPPNRPEYTGR